MPSSVTGSYSGDAAEFAKSLAGEPWLILAAVIAIYIVLGVLYESFIHPLTILSTLPSAGVGALLALLAVNTEFSIIALIGIILLIGIVKKNAISIGSLASDCWNTCAVPWNDPRALAGSPISRMARPMAFTASPSATPSPRLKESVTAGNWPWWFTLSAVVLWLTVAIAPSGTCPPEGVRTYSFSSCEGSDWNSGATSSTTRYWLSCVYMVATCRWP